MACISWYNCPIRLLFIWLRPFWMSLVVALIFLAYTVSLKLQVYFDLSYRNSLKLSLIGIFMSLAAVAKVLLGTVLLVAIGYYMPALLFFVGIGMWHFFISDMLEPVYESIHENWRQNRMKQFWLHTLLRTYSSVMMIIIASFAILLLRWLGFTGKGSSKSSPTCNHSNSRWGGVLLSGVSPTGARFSSQSRPDTRGL